MFIFARTILSFIFARPIMINYIHKKNGNFETNVYALVGKIGKVIVAIDHSKNQGRVLLEGDDWKAVTEDETLIDEGQNVEILKVNSTTLIVKFYKNINHRYHNHFRTNRNFCNCLCSTRIQNRTAIGNDGHRKTGPVQPDFTIRN